MVIQFKEMGFSLPEINELIAQDYIDLVDAYIKANDPNAAKQQGRRRATQEEVDNFTG